MDNEVKEIYYSAFNCFLGEIDTGNKFPDGSEITIGVYLANNKWYSWETDKYMKDASKEELQEIDKCLPF